MKKRLFQRIGSTPIIPISVKIIVIFTVLLLFSNFATNYITISLGRKETMSLTNQLLVRELKEIYVNASNQHQIFLFSNNRADAMDALVTSSERNMPYPNSWSAGVLPSGDFLYKTAAAAGFDRFPDMKALSEMIALQNSGAGEGLRFLHTPAGECFGVYKYHEDWGAFIIVTATIDDMYRASNRVFFNVSMLIVVLTILFMIIGSFALLHLLSYVGKITTALYDMQQGQRLDIIELKDAPNDDVTYLGVSFNALAASINNLLGTFKKFTSEDMVVKAYSQSAIRLEGEQRELTILFSDIRGFTSMTETLGNDIINLLNTHYNDAIRIIHEFKGVIGSIIGDAVLAIYGLENEQDKSLKALQSAFRLQEATAVFRAKMFDRRREIERTRPLSEAEDRVFKVMLLNIGVGIDGGLVFYGTLGSHERMTSTVIGDNVNSASRLEGLTRIYQVPVLVSEYVKNEILEQTSRYRFFEVDMVRVRGKDATKRIYAPIDTNTARPEEIQGFETFEEGLAKYYEGNWTEAERFMRVCPLDITYVFLQRIEGNHAPEGWDGVWNMTTK